MLKIQDLSFAYQTENVIKKLNLQIDEGQIASLIGVSGSGKSTLLRLLTNILSATAGTIKIKNDTTASYMTQNDLLLPWRTVLENILLPTELGKNEPNNPEKIENAKALLNEMGLQGYEHHFPRTLSGGMRQRVSLARALILNRPLLLLDEPFASLDVSLREQMYELLRAVQKKHNTTILMITHDFRDAISLSNQIFHISDGSIHQQWQVDNSQRKDPAFVGSLTEELSEVMRSTTS